MSLEVDIDIDNSAKDFNRDNTLTTITCFILDFDNSDNTSIAIKVFGENLAEDLDDAVDSSKR